METIFARITKSEGTPSNGNYLDALSPVESLATQMVFAQMKIQVKIVGMKNGEHVGVRYLVESDQFPRWQKREAKKLKDYIIINRIMQSMYPNYKDMLSIHEKFFKDIGNYQETN